MENIFKVRLIATDMDGTLLHTDKSLNPEFFTLYKQLKEAGIYFSVASGRQYYSLLKTFDLIKDDIYFISENGANVIYRGNTLFTLPVPRELIERVVKICRELPQADLLLCGTRSAYVEKSATTLREHIKPYYPQNKVVSDLLEPIEDEIVKLAIYVPAGSEKYAYPAVKHLEQEFNVTISAKDWVDISLKEANKGKAIQALQQNLGITFKETMVFGDYLNDREMIENAYYSFAMKNAHPDLKKLARFEAPSNDEDGVLKIIKKIWI